MSEMQQYSEVDQEVATHVDVEGEDPSHLDENTKYATNPEGEYDLYTPQLLEGSSDEPVVIDAPASDEVYTSPSVSNRNITEATSDGSVEESGTETPRHEEADIDNIVIGGQDINALDTPADLDVKPDPEVNMSPAAAEFENAVVADDTEVTPIETDLTEKFGDGVEATSEFGQISAESVRERVAKWDDGETVESGMKVVATIEQSPLSDDVISRMQAKRHDPMAQCIEEGDPIMRDPDVRRVKDQFKAIAEEELAQTGIADQVVDTRLFIIASMQGAPHTGPHVDTPELAMVRYTYSIGRGPTGSADGGMKKEDVRRLNTKDGLNPELGLKPQNPDPNQMQRLLAGDVHWSPEEEMPGIFLQYSAYINKLAE